MSYLWKKPGALPGGHVTQGMGPGECTHPNATGARCTKCQQAGAVVFQRVAAREDYRAPPLLSRGDTAMILWLAQVLCGENSG